MPSVIPVAPTCQTIKPSRKPALSGDRVAALDAVMRRFAREAKSRSAFIEEAFRRGGSYEFQLDDEVIRAAILPVLHELFASQSIPRAPINTTTRPPSAVATRALRNRSRESTVPRATNIEI